MSRTVNFGIVGCGVISQTHADAIHAVPDVATLAACCDIQFDRAEAFSARNAGVPAYRSIEEMLTHPGLDCICVCTPSGLHHEAVLAAAPKGIHAVVEKPMDITPANMEAIIRARTEHGTKVACIFQRRTWSVVNRIREAVQSGRLGRMFLGEARMKWYRSQEYYDSGDWRGTWALDGGGALMNQGIHGIDLLYYVMGPIQSIKAHAATLTHDIEVEDSLTASIRFANGALGSLVVTTSCVPGYTMRHEFNGSKGSIILEEGDITDWHIQGEEPEAARDAAGDENASPAGGASSNPAAIWSEGHTRLIEDMSKAILEGRDPLIPPEEGRITVDLVLAMYESAKTGREVTLC